jgi:poly-beta-1,6-N-acetyl-D-glucosamine synthase
MAIIAAADYVLVTAAHNEAANIEATCHSVVNQSVRPRRWIVVDDASTDGTHAIVAAFRQKHPDLIELLQVKRAPGRDFRNKANAFALGVQRARTLGSTFIGNLDADISCERTYFESLLARFVGAQQLGIGGGLVCSRVDDRFIAQAIAADSVAGAVQLFRRECFDAVCAYLPLELGGEDAAAEIMARKHGWHTRTFFDLRVREHRRTGTANATPLRARHRDGARLFSLGYGIEFVLARSVRRLSERPRVVGSLATLWGYLNAMARRNPVVLPPDVVAFLRSEQRAKLLELLRFGRSASLRRSDSRSR